MQIYAETDAVGGSFFVPPVVSLVDASIPAPPTISPRGKPAPAPAGATSHAPNGKEIALASGMRYDQLLAYVERNPSLSILEIGVARGSNALRLLAYADRLGGQPRYAGIDLFGSLTEAQMRDSFCNEAKRPLSRQQTMDLFREALGADIALRITLFEGLSGAVLPELKRQKFQFDLIFVDGGHSYEAVAGDWQWAQMLLAPGGAIVFDDFPNWGVPGAIAEIDRRQWNVRVLEHIDVFSNHREDDSPAPYRMHQLVEVTRRKAA